MQIFHSNHPNCLEMNDELEIFFRYSCSLFFYGFWFSNMAWVHISLFSRFIDSLNLLRGFFIFVTFVCKSSVIRKIRRALWPNQHLTVAWDVGIFKCHQKVNWVALQIVLVRCDNKLLFYEDQKWTLTDIWSFSNKKKFQWGNFLDMLFLGWINTVIILAPFFLAFRVYFKTKDGQESLICKVQWLLCGFQWSNIPMSVQWLYVLQNLFIEKPHKSLAQTAVRGWIVKFGNLIQSYITNVKFLTHIHTSDKKKNISILVEQLKALFWIVHSPQLKCNFLGEIFVNICQ